MKMLAFQQVDVFTAVPFKGNPVAVVLDGDAVSPAEMQSIAAWTNLAETTFVCAATDERADYRLRIFTPRRELPFAGHPTIGSAHAMLRHGLKPKADGRLVQECGKGLVDIKIDGERLLLVHRHVHLRQDVGQLAVEPRAPQAPFVADPGHDVEAVRHAQPHEQPVEAHVLAEERARRDRVQVATDPVRLRCARQQFAA